MPIEQSSIEHSESPGGWTQVSLIKSQVHNRSANDSCLVLSTGFEPAKTRYSTQCVCRSATRAHIGIVGFEPTTFGSQNRCAIQVAPYSVGTPDWTRTSTDEFLRLAPLPLGYRSIFDRRLARSHHYPPDSLVRYRTWFFAFKAQDVPSTPQG